MNIHNSIADYKPIKKSILTLGTFDGVHKGHQAILKKISETAKERNLTSIVLTFFPHPRLVINSNTDNSLKLLNTIEEKSQLIQQLGIDHFIVHPFTTEFSNLSPEDFVKTILIDQLNIDTIIIGHDHRFGKNRAANFEDLVQLGKKYTFNVLEIPAQLVEEIAVSSTKIRNAILHNQIELANDYLGYNFSITGKVVKGNQIGRTINFPTANIAIEEEYKLIPNKGVYFVNIIYNNKKLDGMLNIGNRPTLENQTLSIEVNIFDFKDDIYEKSITIEFLKFHRKEQKFLSLEELKNQLYKDKEEAENYFRN